MERNDITYPLSTVPESYPSRGGGGREGGRKKEKQAIVKRKNCALTRLLEKKKIKESNLFRGRSQTQQTIGRKRDLKRNAPVNPCTQVHQSIPLQEARFFFPYFAKEQHRLQGQHESNRLKHEKDDSNAARHRRYRSIEVTTNQATPCRRRVGQQMFEHRWVQRCNGWPYAPLHPLQARRDAQTHNGRGVALAYGPLADFFSFSSHSNISGDPPGGNSTEIEATTTMESVGGSIMPIEAAGKGGEKK